MIREKIILLNGLLSECEDFDWNVYIDMYKIVFFILSQYYFLQLSD